MANENRRQPIANIPDIPPDKRSSIKMYHEAVDAVGTCDGMIGD
jgi:hypothetical protein